VGDGLIAASKNSLIVNTRDTVAVALRDIQAGERIEACVNLRARTPIAEGHKAALRPLGPGDAVIKFGAPIGRATAAIAAGDHVHTHNLASALATREAYTFERHAVAPPDRAEPIAFEGYCRPDGRVGTRNEIWIIATVGCVAQICQQIALTASARHAGAVDGVFAIAHPFGCSQLGEDLEATRAILAALAQHPNAGGVVFVGLGCESNQLSELTALANLDSTRMRTVLSQAVDDELEAGLQAVQELIDVIATDRRTPCSSADLVVGLKCGGSDGFSGLTANPLLGALTDQVTDTGGAAILTEIPEIFGAERLLMQRAASADVFEALASVVNDFKSYFIAHGQRIDENPSPGNKAGGITTLEEKSLGAVQKGGRAAVTDVLRYGARVRRPGLSILEAPGNDAVSATALAAAGANIVVFTTGRGTPLGFPVPTVKVSSNTALARRKPRWIDFDAGLMLEQGASAALTDPFLRKVHAIAGGERTRCEENGERSIAIWKRGVTL
jgi:altronate hydrolase